ncbi:MAG: phenylalanine--tRNA ligase subunit beta, partial [candidate division WOR-3 bacterium]
MLVSVKWLEEILKAELPLDDLKKAVLNLGMEIEQVTNLAPADAIIGRVENVTLHPHMKNLCILEVRAKNLIPIVSADMTLKINDLVLVIPAGGKFRDQPVKERDFGGIKSMGILISEEELGLSEKSTGVIVLDKGSPGKKFSDFFDDQVIDIKIPTNRPDLLSVIGLAREIALGFGIGLTQEKKPFQFNRKNRNVIKLVDRDGCPRYTARVFENVAVAYSPFSLKWRLYCMGMNSINNVVDLTNLNMLFYGQPLHPFDLDLLNGPVIIRKAKRGEDFITLEGTHFKLEENDLVIADRDGPIALAGIIGAKRSEISFSTKRVLLESAYFNPQRIAHTRRRLNIQTEASMRFERGVDLSMVDEVSRITGLDFANYAQAREREFISEGIRAKERFVNFSKENLNKILSLNLNTAKIRNLLMKSSIVVKGRENLRARIPHFRSDLQIEADIYEEVARIYGYANIPETPPLRWACNKTSDKNRNVVKFLRDYLVGLGFSEVYNISFVHSQRLLDFGYQEFVRLKNPLNERFDALRPTLFFGLLDCLLYNLSKGNRCLKIFEIGNVLSKKDPFEEKRLGAIMGGEVNPDFWASHQNRIDYYDAKGTVETIFGALRIADIDFELEVRPGFSQSVKVLSSGNDLGYLGMIDRNICESEFFYFELSLDKVIPLMSEPFYSPPGKFPANIRDLSFLVDEETRLPSIKNLIVKVGGPVLEKVAL